MRRARRCIDVKQKSIHHKIESKVELYRLDGYEVTDRCANIQSISHHRLEFGFK